MKTSFKEKAKTNYPAIYNILRKIYTSRPHKYLLELMNYKKCIYTNKPYFGFIMAAGQTSVQRKPYMRKSVELGIKNSKKNDFKILEIGSWAGNSAILWANSIKQSNVNGLVVCVDPWLPYTDPNVNVGISHITLTMERALKNNKIYNLFLHNIRTTEHSDIIKPYRGDSDKLLPTLRDGEFNLVYVDGSHFYSQAIKDLRNCTRLVAEGGFICGDDLEMQIHEVDLKNTEDEREKDYILDPKTNKHFHPGVTLAVAEYFDCEVSCFEGFWIMQKTNSGWKKVILP